MKNIYLLSSLLLIFFATISCKNSEKKEAKSEAKMYSVEAASTAINWIAYKTTNKVPVKGQFNEVIIEESIKSSTPIESLNGLKFKIPVSSLFTNDTIRDGKLKNFFFGTLKNTTLISGIITVINETSGSVEITMNGISKTLPVVYIIKDKMVNIEAVMNLDDWETQMALETLNAVCKDLHTGDDGISKTWNEVKIEVQTNLKYE